MKTWRYTVPLILSSILFGTRLVLSHIAPPAGRMGEIGKIVLGPNLEYLRFAAVLALIVFVVQLVNHVIFDRLLIRDSGFQPPRILREVVAIALYFVFIGWAVSSIFHYAIGALLTTGTVVAAVVGLALQDTLGNLIGGIALHMEQSFSEGDVVRIGDSLGVVESTRWRSTRIRTFNDNYIVLPNSLISRERIEVFPQDHLNGRVLSVGVSYEHPPAKVIRALVDAALNVPEVSSEVPPIARVASFDESSVRYELKYHTRVYARRDSIDAEIRRCLWYGFRREGISIPFPIRTVQNYERVEPVVEVSRDEILSRISEVELLTPLGAELLEELASSIELRRFATGEAVIRFGDMGDSMFIVHQGALDVLVRERGVQRNVAHLSEGDVFGEMALLTGEPRSADVIARRDVILLEIHKRSLRPILEHSPDLAAAISAVVVERRARLEIRRPPEVAEAEQMTLVGRIRTYFGLESRRR
ncbi:MAG: mechanosensitive ion channel family protein [Thermoanaerobaculia bacterium]